MEKSKHLEKIMKKMCSAVGTNWSKVNPKKPNWFLKHSWTMEEQEKFKEWVVDYLYNNSEARKEILTIPVKNKKLIGQAISRFLLDYGWKIK